LPVGARLPGIARKGMKVFWFFFSKKNSFFLPHHGESTQFREPETFPKIFAAPPRISITAKLCGIVS
jgi:hypothetical protein